MALHVSFWRIPLKNSQRGIAARVARSDVAHNGGNELAKRLCISRNGCRWNSIPRHPGEFAWALAAKLFEARAALGKGEETFEARQTLYNAECSVRRCDEDHRQQAIAVLGADTVVGEIETEYDRRVAVRPIGRLMPAKEGTADFELLNALANAVLRYEAKSA
jgi:hypothetical protein